MTILIRYESAPVILMSYSVLLDKERVEKVRTRLNRRRKEMVGFLNKRTTNE